MDTNTQNTNYDFLKNLKNIGTKLADFSEVPKGNEENYTTLGKGNYAYTEKMKSNLDNKFYAIKKLDKKSKKFKETSFVRETQLTINLDHPNIVKFYGYFQDKENINKFKEIYPNDNDIQNQTEDKELCCIVLEFVPNGTLENYIIMHRKNNANNPTPIDENIIIKFCKQLLEVLKYIHNKKIIHRDIKPDNILLDENYNIKVSDFGIAAILRNEEDLKNMDINPELFSNYTTIGRADYMPDELLEGKKYDVRCDIYSLGLTMLSLMSKKEKPIKVFKKKDTEERFKQIDKESMFESYNPYLIKLVKRMMDPNILYRPFANDAYDELLEIEELIKNPTNNIIETNLRAKNMENISIPLDIIDDDEEEGAQNSQIQGQNNQIPGQNNQLNKHPLLSAV